MATVMMCRWEWKYKMSNSKMIPIIVSCLQCEIVFLQGTSYWNLKESKNQWKIVKINDKNKTAVTFQTWLQLYLNNTVQYTIKIKLKKSSKSWAYNP